jgi:hypothetical protein
MLITQAENASGGAMLLDLLGPPQRLLAARWCGRRRRRRRFPLE